MNAYFEHVRDRLSAVLKIPNVHVTSSLKVMLKLTLEESGEVRNPAISQGSGSDELDRAVLEAVDRAKPFSRFSPEMAGLHEVTLTLPVEVRPGR
jgi:TonB family protein